MADFTSDTIPIHASRKRVVALAKASIDKLAIKSTSNFAGTAVLVTIFTVSAHYQYHLVFLDNDFKLVEIWHFDIPKISHSGVEEMEKGIIETVQQNGLKLTSLYPENAEFQAILARLPMAYGDEEETPDSCFCTKKPKKTEKASSKIDSDGKVRGISKEARKALSDFFIQF